jgi:hypothetical protein
MPKGPDSHNRVSQRSEPALRVASRRPRNLDAEEDACHVEIRTAIDLTDVDSSVGEPRRLDVGGRRCLRVVVTEMRLNIGYDIGDLLIR